MVSRRNRPSFSSSCSNLQSVLNTGTYAENLAGNSSMELLGQNGGRLVYIVIQMTLVKVLEYQ
jgi:hypothetical protein